MTSSWDKPLTEGQHIVITSSDTPLLGPPPPPPPGGKGRRPPGGGGGLPKGGGGRLPGEGLRPGGGLDEAVDEVGESLQDTHGWYRQLATQDLANLLQTNFPVLPGKVYRQKFDVKSLPSHHLHYIVLSSSPVEHPLITAPRTNIASPDCSQTLQL